MRAVIASISAALLLTACFPMKQSFYAPSSDGSPAQGSASSGSICTTGVRDVWIMHLTKDVEAVVSAGEIDKSSSGVNFGLLVPEGHTAQLLTADFMVDYADPSTPLLVRATGISASCETPKPHCSNDRLPATDLLHGSSVWKTIAFSKHETKREFWASFVIPASKQFTFRPPQIAVDGTTVTPTSVRFTMVSKTSWETLCQ